MSFIIFIVILIVLILVHELGHFLVAKKFGIRVDEFGLGYPPRIMTLFEKAGTKYTLNWIPFGGFVKIHGENPDETDTNENVNVEEKADKNYDERSFQYKSKWIQASVLVAGVTFNIIFAWFLISVGYMSGLPTPVGYDGRGTVEDAKLVVAAVQSNSPGDLSGLKVGDVVKEMRAGKESFNSVDHTDAVKFIEQHNESPITIVYERGDQEITVNVVAQQGVVEGKKAIGISLNSIGVLKLPFYYAFWEGLITTGYLLREIAVGLGTFIFDSIVGRGDFSQVAGPVGIVGLVGDASSLGIIYLLSFTAFISLNLAVINLVPFPALDGGRLLFVAIEAIKKSPISPKIANGLNGVEFVLLILLMLIVTFNDIIKLFS